MEVLLLILRIKLKGFYFCIYIVEEDDKIKALRKFGFDLVFCGRRFFFYMENRRAVETIKSGNSLIIIVLNDKKFWLLLSNDCETRAS